MNKLQQVMIKTWKYKNLKKQKTIGTYHAIIIDLWHWIREIGPKSVNFTRYLANKVLEKKIFVYLKLLKAPQFKKK